MKIGIMSFAHGHSISYVKLLQSIPGIKLMAADPDFTTRPEGETGGPTLAAELGVPYATTYAQLLAWGPDAVIVCSENMKHRADVEIAAAAGAHVLCEKPLATTVEDARAMTAACDKAGVNLMIAHPVRFSPAVTEFNSLLSAGVLGRVRAIVGTNNGVIPRDRSWFTDAKLAGGGAIADHTVHVADIIGLLLPKAEPRSVYAQANNISGGVVDVETAGLVSITYDNGVIATIDCSWSRPPHYPVWGGLTLDILTDKGSFRLDPFAHRIAGFTESADAVVLDYGENLDQAMLSEFLESIGRGREARPDGHEGERTAAIVEAAYRSVGRGKQVAGLIAAAP
ncbi:Gfo/Idh/MocA family protein [Leifsonia aquatica]|uniref:Gfo/Idh/MocA family protein n=1 Tax=Leifsonia aquatica TaxID=144185 RepID=UPI0028B222AC|nr:Gfo/Idh/MocA family oxidoreductase [Leifsonia aquatica]